MATQIELPKEAQINEGGQIAVKHIQPRRAHIEIAGQLKYVTTIKANISMTWVNPEDLADVLSKLGGCNCGGQKKQKQFLLANEDDVRRWSNGGGR